VTNSTDDAPKGELILYQTIARSSRERAAVATLRAASCPAAR